MFRKLIDKLFLANGSRDYSVYTTAFDREVLANSLSSVLGRMPGGNDDSLEDAKLRIETDLLSWRAGLQITMANASESIETALSRQRLDDISLTILIDQSGSMRGQKMTYTFATMEIIQDFCENLRISYEILGFTTSAWKGGRSRNLWRERSSPNSPGRLNDVLHIIYKDATSPNKARLAPMLRPDLLKENIDGEAIIWAVKRLFALPQSRKLLIVLSDGAPVDDSTLMENGPDYLMDHLRSVVSDISQSEEIEIAAAGLSYRVEHIYPVSVYVDNPKDLAHSLVNLISQMIINDKRVYH